MKPRELALNARDRHLDLFNEYMLGFRARCLMTAEECDELLTIVNEKLPGEGNRIAHWLRRALCEAIDVIGCEDAIAVVDQCRCHYCRTGEGSSCDCV